MPNPFSVVLIIKKLTIHASQIKKEQHINANTKVCNKFTEIKKVSAYDILTPLNIVNFNYLFVES